MGKNPGWGCVGSDERMRPGRDGLGERNLGMSRSVVRRFVVGPVVAGLMGFSTMVAVADTPSTVVQVSHRYTLPGRPGAMSPVLTRASVLLPLIGTVRPWQITFFVVGLPGLVVALMMRGIREPERRGGLMDADGEVRQLSLAQLWRYLTDRWRLYLSFPLATALLGVFSYGLMAWYPTVLIRTYGMTIAEAGTWFGLTYLVFGTAGTYSGARMAEWLERRGHRDAHIRFIMLAAIVMTLPGVLGPLMPTAPLALAALLSGGLEAGAATLPETLSLQLGKLALSGIRPAPVAWSRSTLR